MLKIKTTLEKLPYGVLTPIKCDISKINTEIAVSINVLETRPLL
jgi:hypothetical protein